MSAEQKPNIDLNGYFAQGGGLRLTLTDKSIVIITPKERPDGTNGVGVSYIQEATGRMVSLGWLVVQETPVADPDRDPLFDPQPVPINQVTPVTDSPQRWHLTIARDKSSVDAHDMSIPLAILGGEFEVAKAETQEMPDDYIGKDSGPMTGYISRRDLDY